MDFTGALNFFGEKGGPQMGVPTLISDARPLFGVHPPENAQETLLNGRGFILLNTPSSVLDWSDAGEVRAKYYQEARRLVEKLLPDFEIWPISSHTCRDESIGEHLSLIHI